jgi:hypothetical protein
MNKSILREIHAAGAEMIRDCLPPKRSNHSWKPFEPEPLEAILAVGEHRWFWRPDRVKFVLLAESHVYTDADDLRCKIKRAELPKTAQDAPDQFVRFVYCLGYGNDRILNVSPRQKNSGTDEYWELLGVCAGTLTKKDNSLAWKVKTLDMLKEKGIWLVDASIHACMDPRRDVQWRNIGSRFKDTLYKDLINLSWRYVRPTIEESKEIWYIGSTLKGVLKDKILDGTKSIPQPAGRRNPVTRKEYDKQLPKLIAAIKKICG